MEPGGTPECSLNKYLQRAKKGQTLMTQQQTPRCGRCNDNQVVLTK